MNIIFEKQIKNNDGSIENIKICYDENSDSPRDWDNLAEIVVTNSYKHLGDTVLTEYDEDEDEDEGMDDLYAVWKPLYIYDHSGISLSTTPFSCPWDSGQIGYVGVTWETAKREFSYMSGDRLIERLNDVIEGEIATLNAWVNGEVYGYIYTKTDSEGNEIEYDSCWGYYSVCNMDLKPHIHKIVEDEMEYYDTYKIDSA